MSNYDKEWRKITKSHGLILFGALTGFFLLMRALNLAHVFELRALNIIWVFIVVRSAINTYSKHSAASYYEDFIDFFRIAISASIVGVVLFSVFIAIYLDVIDKDFMKLLERTESAGGLISPVVAAMIIMLEGIVSAGVVAFIYIQWKKSRTVEKPERSPHELKKEAKTD